MTTEELIKNYSDELTKEFPELEVYGQSPSSGDPESFLLFVNYPKGEDEQMRFRWKSADLSLKYFYEHHTMILPVTGMTPAASHN